MFDGGWKPEIPEENHPGRQQTYNPSADLLLTRLWLDGSSDGLKLISSQNSVINL
jgi:hypothetical protein